MRQGQPTGASLCCATFNTAIFSRTVDGYASRHQISDSDFWRVSVIFRARSVSKLIDWAIYSTAASEAAATAVGLQCSHPYCDSPSSYFLPTVLAALVCMLSSMSGGRPPSRHDQIRTNRGLEGTRSAGSIIFVRFIGFAKEVLGEDHPNFCSHAERGKPCVLVCIVRRAIAK